MAAPGRAGAAAVSDLRSRPRLPQGAARSACSELADRLAEAIGPFGHRVFTDSAPVLEVELAAAERHRLARQAHARARPRRPARCSSSARSSSTCALPDDAGRSGALRQLQRVHRRLPDAGDRRAVPARRAPLHLVPDDRADGRDPGRAARRDRQPRLRLRRLPARLPVEQVRAARARSPTSTSARRSTRRALLDALGLERGRRSCATTEGSAIRRIGFERWQRNLAVAPRQRAARERRCRDRRALAARRASAQRRWCASTSTGRCARASARRVDALPA